MAEECLCLESPKGAKSRYWQHFGFEVNSSGKQIDEKTVRCRICHQKVGFSGNTTNLRNHLQKWHPEALTAVTGRAPHLPKQSSLLWIRMLLAPLRQIAEFIAHNMCPVSVIEGNGFQNLVAVLEPAYQVP